MDKENLKNLVKKYFNLEDKKDNTETEEIKATFAEATLADGTKVSNDKDSELAVGDELFVITEEGDKVKAPSGEHTSDSGIVITVDEAGIITGIHRPDEAGEGSLEEMSSESTEETTEETSEEKTEMAEHKDEEEAMEEVAEEEVVEMEDEDAKELIVAAIAEVVGPEIEAMKEQLSSCMAKLEEHEEKMKEHYSKESSAQSVTSSKFAKETKGSKPEVWEYTPKSPKQRHYDAVMAR